MSRLRVFTAAAVIVSLVGASTTAIAASPVRSSVSAPAATAAGSWGTLSVMSGSSAASAALQSNYDDDRGGFGSPSLLSLAVILATIALAIYIITKNDDDDLDFNNTPISPN